MKKTESDDLSSQYGIDVVDELIKMLSEQIAKEVGKDMLNKRRINSINKIFKNVRSSKS